MKWSQNAWEAIKPIYNKILELPFIGELMDGTLPYEKFIFYIQQDALYLAEYGKVLTGVTPKLKKPQHIEAFINFSGDSIAVENALHEQFIKEIAQRREASPGCLLYTSFLLKQLAVSPAEVICAAVLPCFWIYKEVGDYILEKQTKGDNIYQDWINTYGGEDYARSVAQAITICDELAEACTPEQQKAMTEAFVTCSKMEWIFWDSAYKMEEWPV